MKMNINKGIENDFNENMKANARNSLSIGLKSKKNDETLYD